MDAGEEGGSNVKVGELGDSGEDVGMDGGGLCGGEGGGLVGGEGGLSLIHI